MLWDICTLCSTCVKEDIKLTGGVFSSFVPFYVFIESPSCLSNLYIEQLLMLSDLFPLNQKLITLSFSLCSIQMAMDSVCQFHIWKDFSASDQVGLPEKIVLLYAMLGNQLRSGCHCYWTLILPNFLIFKLFFFSIALLLWSLPMIFYCRD